MKTLPLATTTELSLEQKVAQLFMLGYEGSKPNGVLTRFLETGLGGIIFFRDNFQHMEQSSEVAELLDGFQQQRLADSPELFLSIDQEGGQVERLPHTVFPSLVTPRAIGLSQNPESLAKKTYTIMAQHLAALGFNFNYAPTLDVNLEPKNPIIGVRAFGDSAKSVWPLAKIAKDCLWEADVIPVGKHFPGHGNGVVDSHLKLPHLTFTEEELSPFQSAIDDNIPIVLVSHGFYPALQKDKTEYEQPASASKGIIQDLLKKQCGFSGLVISDDMCMGAITQEKDPIDAAIQSLEAGIDMLVYKQSTDIEWNVYQGIINAVRTGRLNEARIDEAYVKITELKSKRLKPDLNLPPASAWNAEYLAQLTAPIAQKAITLFKKSSKITFPAPVSGHYLLVHPSRNCITNYRFDQPTSQELPELLRAQGLAFQDIAYEVEIPGQHQENAALPGLPNEKFDAILFVTFNPLIQPIQQVLYKQLKMTYPDIPVALFSAGTAYDLQCFPDADAHVALCSYRPPSMQALTRFIVG